MTLIASTASSVSASWNPNELQYILPVFSIIIITILFYIVIISITITIIITIITTIKTNEKIEFGDENGNEMEEENVVKNIDEDNEGMDILLLLVEL